jgi:hypothetical protein
VVGISGKGVEGVAIVKEGEYHANTVYACI